MSGYLLTSTDLDKIEPTDVEAVLRSLGWVAGGGVPNLASQWIKEDESDEPSVLVPLNQELADYRQRMTEVIRSLYEYHASQVDNLIVRLLIPGVDEISNQKEDDTIAGSIPWTAGENQILGFRNALVAAAKAAEGPERHFGNKRWMTGHRYLSQLRMGQTRIGSYVVTALSPVGPLPLTNQKEEYATNLGITGRDVLRSLSKGLETLRESSVEFMRSRNDGVFIEAVESGVSLDLVKAVQLNLGNADAAQTLITWTSRINQDANPTTIVFERNQAPALQSAVTRLTETIRSKQVTIIGRVTGLDRDEPGELGNVVVHVLDGADDRVDYVSVTLGTDYDQAVDFHKAGQLVQVSGELKHERRKWHLTGVTRLRLLSTTSEPIEVVMPDTGGTDDDELPF